jgi:chromosomal replication initiation ATPase DnaA
MNAFDHGNPMLEPDRVIDAYVKIRRVRRQLLLATMPQSHTVSAVRHELMYLMRHLTALSMESIADLMGGRHASTIWAGVEKITLRASRDRDYADYIAGLGHLIAAQVEAEDTAQIAGGIAHVL